MNNILPLQRFGVVYKSDVAESERRLMLRSEQESVRWMTDLVTKFSGPGDLVVKFCAGSMEVAKAWLLLSEHRRFKRCGMDEICVKEALRGLVEVYPWQELSSESNLTMNEDFCNAALVF